MSCAHGLRAQDCLACTREYQRRWRAKRDYARRLEAPRRARVVLAEWTSEEERRMRDAWWD